MWHELATVKSQLHRHIGHSTRGAIQIDDQRLDAASFISLLGAPASRRPVGTNARLASGTLALPDSAVQCANIFIRGILSPTTAGKKSRKQVVSFEPLNQDTAESSVSLSSPKGGEGWGEEASGLMGKHHPMFGVQRSMFDVRCSQIGGEGLSPQVQRRYFPSPLFH
jgi:hypothetical protein